MSEENQQQAIAGTTPPAPDKPKSKTTYVVLWAACPDPDSDDDQQMAYRILGQVDAYNTSTAKSLALEQANSVDKARIDVHAKGHGVVFQAVATRSWEINPKPSRLVVHEPEWEIN